ncbi:NADH:flavin oxidoreductase [Clostridium sp. LP20]|uniref:NADH:flavin oxidoreductase n=1 Tax=Clostridium sp. LP20 TaxID=3418665 RepID=UPI003EE7C47C
MNELFGKSTIKNVELKNSIIRSAVCEKLADDKGHLLENYKKLYEELAKGGVGLIITGYTTIFPYDKPSNNMSGIYDDSFIDEHKEVVDIIHKEGAKVISQIVLGKEYINEKDGFKSYDFTDEFKDEYIEDIIQAFANAAIRVKKAGFDGVQLHCAHGYFLSRTLSPIYNKRSDEYGREKYKLITEVYKGVREVVGEDYLISIKINTRDKEPEGANFDICYKTCIELDKVGIDLIEISGGDFYDSKYINREGIYKIEADKVAREVKCKVAVVGLNRSLNSIEEILRITNIGYISMARPFICQPDIVNKFLFGEEDKAKCISCGKCYTDEYGNQCAINK